MSNIKTYSLKKNGATKLSTNFTAREFSSKDGADTILIDSDLVTLLQQIRDKFGAAVTINSGYRTDARNKAIGGAENSLHVRGMAADIVVKGVSAKRVAQYAEAIGANGIGWYETKKYTHIDTRTTKCFWKDERDNLIRTFSDCPYAEPTAILVKSVQGTGVKWLQWHLNKLGSNLTVDGIFGANTRAAVVAFQTKQKLTVDSIVGVNTRSALKLEVV